MQTVQVLRRNYHFSPSISVRGQLFAVQNSQHIEVFMEGLRIFVWRPSGLLLFGFQQVRGDLTNYLLQASPYMPCPAYPFAFHSSYIMSGSSDMFITSSFFLRSYSLVFWFLPGPKICRNTFLSNLARFCSSVLVVAQGYIAITYFYYWFQRIGEDCTLYEFRLVTK